jgi:hypothetical protein
VANPWSVAGCNKPARFCAEQTVEVGRNDKGGTSVEVGILIAEGCDARTDKLSGLEM